MKTLFLLRHAKSEDPILLKSDFKRHLKDRGVKDIRKVSEQFHHLKYKPDVVYSSSANRTRETFEQFANVTKYQGPVNFIDELYHASSAGILEILEPLFEKYNSIMIVGHNFGISDLADYLCMGSCNQLPTSGLVVLEFKNGIIQGTGVLKHFIAPKDL